MRPLLIATFVVSASAIGYELLLMRLLSIVQWHHFAYMVISLALLGYGASGTYIALRRQALERQFSVAWSLSAMLFSVMMIVAFAVGQRIPFNALEIVWDPGQFLRLAAMYLVFFLPFFFAAMCIGLAFTFRKSLIERIYFCDLCGAACGAVAIVGSLYLLAPQDALTALSGLALLAAVTVAWASRYRRRLIAAGAAWAAILVAGLPGSWLDLRVSPYKGLSQAMQVVDARVVAGVSGPIGMLTVLESPTVPFREAPGLSLNTRSSPPEQLAMFTDGDAMSPITRWDGAPGSLDYLTDLTAAAPYQLLDAPRVLVLGAGGGSDVLLALRHGAGAVDAVEINPQAIAMVRDRFAEYAGDVYRHPRVTVHSGEARGFVSARDDRYHLIQIALLDSFAASGAGVHALSENYLYTVEALRQYLQRLEPGGVLALTRWLKLPPRDSLKLVATAIEALRREGVPHPDRHLAVLRSWNTATILVGRDEFSPSDVNLLRRFAADRSFDMAWYPGMPPEEANRFNLLQTPWLFEGIGALLGAAPEAFQARYKFRIEPATDDRPYFFHFFKWRVLPDIVEVRGAGGAGLLEWGYLILIGTLVQAIIAGAALILLPLFLSRRHRVAGFGRAPRLYFFVVGLAFMFVEIAFIQKFILFLSHPLYAIAVVLSGFLLFAGIGSASSSRLKARLDRLGLPIVPAAAVSIAVITLTYVAALPVLTASIVAQPDATRVLISLTLIAPLGFCMGLPFPIGLRLTALRAPEFIPWAWAINGFASVISTSLATLVAIDFGFTAVLVVALTLYLSAALLIHRPMRDYGDSI